MSALEGLKNSIRRWGGSDDDESYSNELESAKEEPVQEVPSRSSSQASNANKIYTYNASTTLHLVVNRPMCTSWHACTSDQESCYHGT